MGDVTGQHRAPDPISGSPVDPALDALRLPASNLCWWCGALATTDEHRFKHSTLRRVAGGGATEVFKVRDDFQGTLRSLRKGSQVVWAKSMCADCNNRRSQPFDRAYDVMEAFLVENADEMMKWDELQWQEVYGEEWQRRSADLARYFGKQMGCMLAGQRLSVPEELIEFLDGADRCPSIQFILCRSWRAGSFHKVMVRDGFEQGITTQVGFVEAMAYQSEGRLAGLDFGYYIGYVMFCARWREGQTTSHGGSMRPRTFLW